MSAPRPPGDLDRRTPDIVELPAGFLVHRFHHVGRGPIYFNPGASGRLNAPAGQYGVLYTSLHVAGAFAETFLRNPGQNLIAPDQLAATAYSRLETTAELTFIKLAGPGLARLGATAEVTHGGLPYDVPQEWSLAIHGAFPGAAGIAYTARHDDQELCFAIFDRVAAELRVADTDPDLDANWFWEVAEAYDVGLAPGMP